MAEPTLLLDISRTVGRARLPVPTGIDRVERAYIDWALKRDAIFLAHIDAKQYLLDAKAVQTLMDWLDGDAAAPRRDLKAYMRPKRPVRLTQAQSLIRRYAFSTHRHHTDLAKAANAKAADALVYLNTGHDNCTKDLMQAFGREGITRLALIHDTIPLDYPEFARPETPSKFRAMLNAAGLADGLLVNSAVTQNQVTHHLAGDQAPCWVAPLGVDAASSRSKSFDTSAPFFVCIGTIEPRKNHALLLNLWQNLHRERPETEIPHLYIVGRRGWLNEDVFQNLDTLPFMGKTVFESTLPDEELSRLIVSARAVLFPSLAEGYGLPLAEALTMGTPVIASDLPILREVGGDAPKFLSVDDPDAWLQAIDAYTDPGSDCRRVQIGRISRWKRPTWDAHFSIVENAIETILVQTQPNR